MCCVAEKAGDEGWVSDRGVREDERRGCEVRRMLGMGESTEYIFS
jgi:hypothetical protein